MLRSAQTQARWAELSPLLDQLLDLDDPQRAAALAAVADTELRQRLSELLAGEHSAGLLDSDSDALARALLGDADSSDLSGEHIGGYTLGPLIGEGGSGSVYRAWREHQGYRQDVALKLLRVGVRDALERARFTREQRILARLSHPNIARLIDAGVSVDGVPWFAMEYVEGEPLLAWCDRQLLDLRSRIELFCRVCTAVGAAHASLIVHRDLKPANLLVGADGEPKLLDFGIAKLLEDSERAEDTRTGQRRLTPAYAAPEQFEGGALGTAVDIYALGVLLHELLAGRRPERLSDGTLKLASARLRSSDEREALAALRGSSARRLLDALRGDLDTVLQTALAFRPQDRYPSVEALAGDLQRHLSQRPLRARPPTFGYRSGRFIRRNLLAVAASVALVLSILVGLVAALRGAEAAREQAQRAEAVKQVVIELFRGIHPDESRGRSVSARELLERGEQRALEALREQPALTAELSTSLAEAWTQLGEFERADGLLQRASGSAARPDDRASVFRGLGRLRLAEARHAEAEDAFLQALETGGLSDPLEVQVELAELIATRGDSAAALAALDGLALPDDAAPLRRIRLLAGRGAVRFMGSDLEGAVADFESALAIAAAELPEPHSERARLQHDLAVVLLQRGDPKAAGALLEQAVSSRELLLGGRHPDLARSRFELAVALQRQGRIAEAKALLEDTLALQRELFGDAHADVANSLNSLAVIAQMGADWAQATAYFRQALVSARGAFGAQHPRISTLLANLSSMLRVQGQLDEAEQLQREALAMSLAVSGLDNFQTAVAQIGLAVLLFERGELTEAEAQFKAGLPMAAKQLDAGHLDLAQWQAMHAELLIELGEADAARAGLAGPLETAAKLPQGHPRRARIELAGLRLAAAESDCGPVGVRAAEVMAGLVRGGAALAADRASLHLLVAACATDPEQRRAERDAALQELQQLAYVPRRLREAASTQPN
jgi:serine/threonine-protein kinase